MFLVTHARGFFDVARDFLVCKETHAAAVFQGEIPLSQAFLAADYALKTLLLAFEDTLPLGGVVTPAASRNEGPEAARLYDLCLGLLEHNSHSGDLYYP